MQDCWQKSTAAGFIREEMIAAIESNTGKPSVKINCTKISQNLLKS
jgi:transcriptional regulator with AAA-type ATPase domain